MENTLQTIPEFKISLNFKQKPAERIAVKSSEDAAAVCRKCFDADTMEWTESFIVIALNRASKVIGFYKVSQGGLSGTVADPRVILQFALLSNASSIILAHNHPSGNLNPSNSDKQMTTRLCAAAMLMEIQILDHIIMTAESHYSFLEHGEL